MAINKIFTNQNKKKHIDYLKAQRVLYSQAKKNQKIINNGDIVFLVLGGGISVAWPSTSFVVSVISIIWLISSFLIKHYIVATIKKASTIQEDFDVSLFNIGWNKALIRKRITDEEIVEASDNFKGDVSKLFNWYPKTNTLNTWEVVVNCQKTNTNWDIRLREKYNVFALIVLVIFVSVSIVSFCGFNLNFRLITSVLIAPSLPFLITTFTTFIENKRNIKEKEELQILLTEKLKPNKLFCRQVQDKIYSLRNTFSIIPDWFYWLFREKFEKQAKQSAKLPKK